MVTAVLYLHSTYTCDRYATFYPTVCESHINSANRFTSSNRLAVPEKMLNYALQYTMKFDSLPLSKRFSADSTSKAKLSLKNLHDHIDAQGEA